MQSKKEDKGSKKVGSAAGSKGVNGDSGKNTG